MNEEEIIQSKPKELGQEGTIQTGSFQELVIPFLDNGRPATELPEALASSSAQIVFVQDIHNDPRIRNALSYTVAQRLYQLGFRHYLVEAPKFRQRLFDQLNKGQAISLYDIPYIGPLSFGDRSFANAIYAMHGAGMQIHAVDYDQNYTDAESFLSPKEKEEYIFNEVKKAIGESRAICLIGSKHAQLGNIEDNTPTLAQRLVNSGYSITSVGLTNK